MATIDQVRDAMHGQPFRGFTVRLVDGRSYVVKHPDFISVPVLPRGRDLVIHDREGTHHIDILLVVEVEIPEPEEAGSQAQGRPRRPPPRKPKTES
jgi:hypothetical protein